jgi:hypothetical protein
MARISQTRVVDVTARKIKGGYLISVDGGRQKLTFLDAHLPDLINVLNKFFLSDLYDFPPNQYDVWSLSYDFPSSNITLSYSTQTSSQKLKLCREEFDGIGIALRT